MRIAIADFTRGLLRGLVATSAFYLGIWLADLIASLK